MINPLSLTTICAKNIKAKKTITTLYKCQPIYDTYITSLSFIAYLAWRKTYKRIMAWKATGRNNYFELTGIRGHPKGKHILRGNYAEIMKPLYYARKYIMGENGTNQSTILLHMSNEIVQAVIYKFNYIDVSNNNFSIDETVSKINSVKKVNVNTLKKLFEI